MVGSDLSDLFGLPAPALIRFKEIVRELLDILDTSTPAFDDNGCVVGILLGALAVWRKTLRIGMVARD
jgi:hypothetical protein